MDVFDTNIWILGFTESSPRAAALVEEVLDGDRDVSVSAYIYEKILEAFERTGLSRAKKDRTITNFAAIVEKSHNIVSPAQLDLRNIDLKTVQSHAGTRLLGAVLESSRKTLQFAGTPTTPPARPRCSRPTDRSPTSTQATTAAPTSRCSSSPRTTGNSTTRIRNHEQPSRRAHRNGAGSAVRPVRTPMTVMSLILDASADPHRNYLVLVYKTQER